MDERQARRFRERAIFVARKLGFSEHAEDLAQDVLARYLDGYGKGQTVDQAVIDAVRRTFGSTRNGRFNSRRSAGRPHFSLDDMAPGTIPGVNQQHDLDFERLIEGLNPSDRAVICLRYVWGFTEEEIGNCFGVTESRISQRLRSIQERIQTKVSKELPRAEPSIRECKKPPKIPRQVQRRPSLYQKANAIMDALHEKERGEMEKREEQEAMAKLEVRSFDVSGFFEGSF